MSTENLPAEQKTQLPEGTVTVLFTDLVDSTLLNQQLGDEAAHALSQSLVAHLQSVITNDGVVNGHRFLTSETCDFAFRSQHRGIDLVLGSEFNFSLGYGLSTEAFNFGPRTACWGGAGGSMTFLDQELGLTMSYVMNKMAPFDNDSRADDLFSTTRKVFGK